MSKFPLIEELGLSIHEVGLSEASMVYAEEIECLLSQAPVVYGKWRPDGEHGWVTEEWSEKTDTHTARLIGVREIKKDSAEDLIRDWLEKFESGQGFDMSPYINRAKRLVGVKEIKKDTAESLLKEIIEQLDMRLKDCGGGEYRFATSDALERARKLLEEKK